jgi:hypothetical protein
MYAELITAAIALTPTTLVPRQAGNACPTIISCPTDNGCSSTESNGAIFQLKCTTNFNGPVIEINQVPSQLSNPARSTKTLKQDRPPPSQTA